MFFINYKDTQEICTYECGLIVSKYLINKGVPLLSYNKENNKYIFKDSAKLRNILMDAPIWIKMLT